MNYFPMMKKNYLTPIKNYLFKIKNYSKHILTVYANAEIQKDFRLKSPQWLHQPFNYILNESLFIFLFILYFCIFYLYDLYSAISVYILLHALNITFLTGLSANKSNIPITPHTMNSLAPIVTKNIANIPSEP